MKSTQMLRVLSLLCCALLVHLGPPRAALAAVIGSGDFGPADFATWAFLDGYVGTVNDGTLTVDEGSGLISKNVFIGYQAGATGEVTVDGAGSTLTNDDQLNVGYRGDGTLSITSGGAVSNTFGFVGREAGSTGAVTVDGAGSTWSNTHDLYVGQYGSGAISISNGGALTLNTSLLNDRVAYLGAESGSSGVVMIDGVGSTWTNNVGRFFLVVGGHGDGAISITRGAALSNTLTTIGVGSGTTGEVLVDGLGSTWTSEFSAVVGGEGNGKLTISSGATVVHGDGAIGLSAGSTGEVTVDGAGSTWNPGALTVGRLGDAKLTISGGGAVTVTRDTHVAQLPGSSGEIHFAGGTLTTADLYAASEDLTGVGTIHTEGLVSDFDLVFDATHGSTQTFTLNDHPGQDITVHMDLGDSNSLGVGHSGAGTMTIREGAVLGHGAGYAGLRAGSSGVVTVDGVGSSWNLGRLTIGRSGAGLLTISDGGMVTVSGTLTVDSDSNGDGFIHMASGGMLALAGDADDSLSQFFGLVQGTDAIRYWNDGLVDWDSLTSASHGVDYTLEYLTTGDLAGYTLLTVIKQVSIPGDANGDGSVDILDLDILSGNFGTVGGATLATGDFNGDGNVDITDLNILSDYYGTSAAGSAAIPEPAALVLVLAALATWRHRPRSTGWAHAG